MPLYDYTCRNCGKTSELFLRGDALPTPCPACGSTEMERLPSLFAVNTEQTRQASLTKARAANLPIEKDKAIAQEEYVNKHHD